MQQQPCWQEVAISLLAQSPALPQDVDAQTHCPDVLLHAWPPGQH